MGLFRLPQKPSLDELAGKATDARVEAEKVLTVALAIRDEHLAAKGNDGLAELSIAEARITRDRARLTSATLRRRPRRSSPKPMRSNAPRILSEPKSSRG